MSVAPISADELLAPEPEIVDAPSPGLWKRFTRNKVATICLFLLGGIVLVALCASVIAPYTYDRIFDGARMRPPGGQFRLGTDDLGRDTLSRLIYGARISLSVALCVEAVVVTLGLLVGLVAGYFGGKIDAALMWLTNVMLAFPDVLLAILLLGTLSPKDARPEKSLLMVVISLGVTGWPPLARLVRGQVLSLRKREFVEAATALGASNTRILLRHILPNLLSPLIVAITVDIAGVILAEATLSFLGIGVQRPYPSWGRMINDALSYYKSEPRLVFLPALFLSTTVIALNFVGDGLRDALDPRRK